MHDAATKTPPLVFSRHTPSCGKKTENSRLEHEFGGRCETGKQRRRGIEYRPAAHVAADHAVNDGTASGHAAHHRNQSSPVLELSAQGIWRDFGRAIEEDDVVGRG